MVNTLSRDILLDVWPGTGSWIITECKQNELTE